MQFVWNVADYCHYLASGVIIKSGNTHAVLEDEVVKKDYLGI